MEKKDLIRITAIKVIAQYGYHNTKVQTIADEAGVANGTVYHYFKSKQEILEYIYEVEIEKWLKRFNEFEEREGCKIYKLQLFMDYILKECKDNFDVVKILIHDGLLPINNDSNSIKMFYKLITKLAKAISEGCKSRQLKQIDAKTFAFIIINVLGSATYVFKLNKNLDENSDEYKVRREQVINFILDGIRKV